MASSSSRPALRPVESIVVPDRKYGQVLVLRDTQGVTDAHAVIPPPLVPIVSRMTGDRTCEQIAREASGEIGQEVPIEVVVKLTAELDKGLFLEGPTFRAAKRRIEDEFRSSSVRPASHAGGAYHSDARQLMKYIDDKCLGAAGRKQNGKRLQALIAPHIDPWRGAVSYGHAYGAAAATLSEDVDTFIVLGTSHAPMREHFALCRKAFDTPFGHVHADTAAIDAIAAAAPFDPYADEFNHKREHSLEFQVVFLKHLLRERPFKIVPILAGLGEHQARGTDPAKDDHANRFLDAVRDLVESRQGKIAIIAGADLAHVGPRFGDPQPMDATERGALERTDLESLSLALERDTPGFWAHVASDLHTRRVCGLGPIYALLRALPDGTRGELHHYEQTVDADDGSIVSHAAVAFYG
jgi:hypothetical protein